MSNWNVNDPIYGKMYWKKNDVVKKIQYILSTKCFQRLRHLSQLGLAQLVYPSATHNRISHSLGTAYLASRVVNDVIPRAWNADEFILASLLHDLGHGPFSHSFERFIENITNKKISDKEWTRNIIEEILIPETNDKGDCPPINWNCVKEILAGESSEYGFENTILSSSIDIDRMDYLMRDGHFCGLPYGKIDFDQILSCISENDDPEVSKAMIDQTRCRHALNHFFRCREAMYTSVYYHPTTVSAEHCLVELMEEIVCNSRDFNKNIDLPPFFISLRSLKAKGKLDKTNVLSLTKEYSMLSEFQIWKMVEDLFIHESDNQKLNELSDQLLHRKFPKFRCKVSSASSDFSLKIMTTQIPRSSGISDIREIVETEEIELGFYKKAA